jgi:hypothetical protein
VMSQTFLVVVGDVMSLSKPARPNFREAGLRGVPAGPPTYAETPVASSRGREKRHS